MGNFLYKDELVTKIYSLPKTKEAVSEFLNAYYDEVQKDGSIRKRQIWERFEGAYVSVTNKYIAGTDNDNADVYMIAHRLVSRCVLGETSPYFESDGQMFAYYKLMVRSTNINREVKENRNKLVLVEDLLGDIDDEDDVGRFEDEVMGFTEIDDVDTMPVIEVLDTLKDEDLKLFGRLFISNNYSFKGMYGLCGWDLNKFNEVRRAFIREMKSYFEGRDM